MKKYIFLVLTLLVISGCSQQNNDADKQNNSSHAESSEHGHEESGHDESGHDESGHEESGHEESGHEESGHEESGHDESGVVKLSSEQMKMANIIVQPLFLKEIATSIVAPGEVKLNAYKTIKVTPRIAAQVIARHAILGDAVEKGQDLVTLSSVEMAEAQGQLLLADKEWKRVLKLGKKVVSQRRYITAKVNYEKALASVKAYGMGKNEISGLLAQKRSADGSFKLVASQAGRILHDKFIVGERVEAGYELMVIADESTMWVEARVTPSDAGKVNVGNAAEISFGNTRIPATVIQLHHSLDETTRTAAIRIEVDNKSDVLHAGMYVTARINTSDSHKGFSLPESAVLRSPDGDWQILVEQDEAGEFKPLEIELKQINNGQAIISGVKEGMRVVTQGAFFVQSELAKSGFSVHNH